MTVTNPLAYFDKELITGLHLGKLQFWLSNIRQRRKWLTTTNLLAYEDMELIPGLHSGKLLALPLSIKPGRAKANGRELRSWVFHFKLGSLCVMKEVHNVNARPGLKLNTWPRFHPASLSLSMIPLWRKWLRMAFTLACYVTELITPVKSLIA
jgi:hypothetical protein